MSFIKINNQTISMNDLMVWVYSYIDIYNSGGLKNSETPSAVKNIFQEDISKEEKAEKLIGHIQDNAEFLITLQNVVKDTTSKKVFGSDFHKK